MNVIICAPVRMSSGKPEMKQILAFKSDHIPLPGEKITLSGHYSGEYKVKKRDFLIETRQAKETVMYNRSIKVVDETVVLTLEKVKK